ncbi:MAG: MBL fold metallo-hydrolase [Treponema sp.]|nr:MBL fold metallo-hydrolase [Treponema sp.]
MDKMIFNMTVGDLETNCWIHPLETVGSGPAPCAVIDPGGEGERIMAFLDRLSLFPAYILLTHGHFDHILAVPTLMAECLKRGGDMPKIAVHAGDSGFLGSGALERHRHAFAAVGASQAYVDEFWHDMPEPDVILAEGDEVGPFSVLHLPGHSPGSIGLYHAATGSMFSGDTLFRGAFGRTDLPGGSGEELAASVRRLFSMDGRITAYPGHGPTTTIGEERSAFE